MKNGIVNELITAMKERIPKGQNLANSLADILYMGKEAVYRRLRGEVAFTIDEVALLSKKLGISIDQIIGNHLSNRVTFDMNLLHSPNTLESYYEIISRYQSREDLWTLFTRLPIVFIYNNKLVGKEDAPHSWKELFTDDWRGRIAFADPARSGSSCTMLETMLQVLDGDEDQVLKDFAGALDGSLLESSGAVLEDVAAGRKMVGITLEETARKWIDRGADLTIVYPEEGTSALPDGCAVVKGARHRKNAELFLEFIVSDDTQRFAGEYLCRRTIREDLELETREPGGKLIRFDLELAVGRQKRILEKWAVLTDEGKN